MEDTQVGRDLIAIGRSEGGVEAFRDALTELLAAKLGRLEKTWPDDLRSITSISTMKALYSSVLHAKSRKQVKDLLHASFGNGARKN